MKIRTKRNSDGTYYQTLLEGRALHAKSNCEARVAIVRSSFDHLTSPNERDAALLWGFARAYQNLEPADKS